MKSTRNNVVLLFFSQFYEVYCIARNSYSELRVLLGVCLSVKESFTCENVYVEVVSAFFNVAVKQFDEVVYLFLIIHILSFLLVPV